MRAGRDGGRWLDGVARTVCLGMVVGMLAGCDSMMSRSGETGGQPTASAVRDPVLQDIPKPAGFVLDPDRSVALSSGKFRLAKCEYGGSLRPAAVKRFYEEYMPSANFELRRWSLDQGEFKMTFESGTEICTVRARPAEWNKTAVVVEITPKPQGSVERQTGPPQRRPQ